MKVVIAFEWTCNNRPQEPLHKIVDMPCLPPIGTNLYLEEADGHLDEAVVAGFEWFENHPEIYGVRTSPTEVEGDEVDFVDWMKTLGWTDEWWGSLLDEPPADPNTDGV